MFVFLAIFLCFTSVVQPVASVECVDKFASCRMLAKTFTCGSADLQNNCPKSCNACPTSATIKVTTTTTPKPVYSKDCAAALASGRPDNSLQWVLPPGLNSPMQAYCTAGWQLLQSRRVGDVDFDKTWVEYKTGFGLPTGDYWWGLEHMHKLTTADKYKLRVEVELDQGNTTHTDWMIMTDDFESFSISSEATGYTIKLGNPIKNSNSSAGNDMALTNGRNFETKDKLVTSYKCAQIYAGGFWMEESCGPNLNAKMNICPGANNVCGLYGGLIKSSRMLMRLG